MGVPIAIWLVSGAAGAAATWLYRRSHARSLAPGQVEAVRTVLTSAQARGYLHAALRAELGREPTAAELAMVAAQSSFETRRWQAMWNWNYGNITTTRMPWFTLRAEEIAHRYKPYASAYDGARRYVAFLRRVYPEAWSLIGSGDTYAFANALKSRGYFEGNPAGYAAGLDTHYA